LKKILSLILALLLFLTLTPVFALDGLETEPSYYTRFANDNITLEVYNWGEYISDGADDSMNVIEEFTKLTGIEVNYTNFASNEEMHTKIAEGGVQYDVLIPSDYMIARMIEEGLLEKLDFDNIPNFALLDDSVKNREFDPSNEYSVPYMSGMVGIIYNTTMVKGEVDSWDILWDQNYSGKILMFDNPRDAFGIALLRLGYSVNTTDADEIAEAAQSLKDQRPLVQRYVMDQVFNIMEAGNAAVAPYYAGDAITMIDANPDLAFAIPKEGTNFFIDAMVVPKGSPHKEAAEMFINFMCEPVISAANAEYIGYSTPIPQARDMLDMPEEFYAIAYPSEEVLRNTEVFRHLPEETNELMAAYWVEIKADNKSAQQWVAVILCVVLVLAALIIMVVRIRKKKRTSY